MKTSVKFLIAFLFILLSVVAIAQSPQAFNYQAVARNAAGNVLPGMAVGIRVSLHQGSESGDVVYSETFAPTTNEFGLFTLAIGTGSVVSGDFSTINWSDFQYWLQIEADLDGGSSYTNMGTSQLLSVPYAMYASSTSGVSLSGAGMQTLYHNGTSWVAGNSILTDGKHVGINSAPLSSSLLYVNRPLGSYGADSSGIYVVRSGNSSGANGGTSWGLHGVDAGIKAFSNYGNNYSAGIAGYGYLDYPHSAAIFGSKYDASVWGALAYKDAASILWAGYFTGNVSLSGSLRIQGGSPGAGKVLTSDANGVGTWLTPEASSNVVVGSLNGYSGSSIPTVGNAWNFIGPSTVVTLSAGQKVVIVYTASLGKTAAGNSFFRLDVGYQLNSGGSVYNASGGAYINQKPSIAASEMNVYTMTGVISPGAGTWKIGAVIYAPASYFNYNDYCNGYYMIISE